MLIVVKIIDGGVDLYHRTELSKCIVVSNGRREVTIPVTNEGIIQDLVQMYAEDLSQGEVFEDKAEPKKASPAPVGPASKIQTFVNPELDADYDKEYADTRLTPKSWQEPDEEQFSPGEEYVDTGTGAESV